MPIASFIRSNDFISNWLLQRASYSLVWCMTHYRAWTSFFVFILGIWSARNDNSWAEMQFIKKIERNQRISGMLIFLTVNRTANDLSLNCDCNGNQSTFRIIMMMQRFLPSVRFFFASLSLLMCVQTCNELSVPVCCFTCSLFLISRATSSKKRSFCFHGHFNGYQIIH